MKAAHEQQAHQLAQQCLRLSLVCLNQARTAAYHANYRDHELKLFEQLADNIERMSAHLERLTP